MRAIRKLAIVLLAVAPSTLAYAGEPTETVRGGVERAVQVLANPALSGDANIAERHRELRAIAGDLFDFEGMSRRALGTHWRERTAEEQQRFVTVFTELLEHTYFSKIDASFSQLTRSIAGSTVRYDAENLQDDEATVRTTIVTAKGTEIPVSYRLARKEDRWLIVDIDFGGVTLVSSYRAQFNQIIRSSSFETLVQRLDRKPNGGAKPAGAGS